jgi:hypothetical protein
VVVSTQGAELATEVDVLLRDHPDPLLEGDERLVGVGRRVELPDPLAVVAAAGGLGDHRPADLVAEDGQGGRVVDDSVRRARCTERAEPGAHDGLVLSMDEGVRTRPNGDAGVHQFVQQVGWHVLVVEGDHVAAPGERLDGIRIGVVADRHVVHDGGRGGVGALGQQPQSQPETGGRLVHHPGELTAADHADYERSLGVRYHPPSLFGEPDGSKRCGDRAGITGSMKRLSLL